MTDINWRKRANNLESQLMWTGAAIDLALAYLKKGQIQEAQHTLYGRLDLVKNALLEIQEEGR